MANRYFDMLRDPTESEKALDRLYTPNDTIKDMYEKNLQPIQVDSVPEQNVYRAAGYQQNNDGTFQTPMRDMANYAEQREIALQQAYRQKYDETRGSLAFKVADTLADTGRLFLSPLLWLGGEDPTKYDPSYQLEAGYRKQFDASEQFRQALYTKVSNAREARRLKAQELVKTASTPTSSEGKKLFDFARQTNQLDLYNEQTSEAIANLTNQMQINEGTAFQISNNRVIKDSMLTRLEGYGTDFKKLTTVASEAYSGYNRLMTALTTEQTGVADIAAIFGFMKTLDPRSVVRESEFQVAAEAGGIWDKLTNIKEKYADGQKLPDTVRKEMAELSTLLMKSYKESYERHRADYESKMGYMGYGGADDINTFLGQRMELPKFDIQPKGNTIQVPEFTGAGSLNYGLDMSEEQKIDQLGIDAFNAYGDPQ